MGTALVTGATSGIGQEFCWQLASEGHNIVLVARTKDRLRALAENIARVHGVHVEVLPADLAEPEDLARVCTRLTQTGPEVSGKSPVTILVNGAGFGFGTSFLDDEFERELYGMDVMVRAVMATCYYAGRTMRERGEGAIVNISSVAADTGMGPYSAHKAWVRAFSEGLYEELKGTGVTVTATMPGLTHSEFHKRAGGEAYYGQAPEVMWMTPDQVVRETLAAVKREQVLVTPSLRYKAIYHTTRVMPRFLVRTVVNRLPHA